ncbi:hypothetical protein AMECASPLE_024173 [Ameca splendens]|uniref:Uncharacterized protein n=1 Tax=Ameca splendens TaxID=208324 RepID=A0ABV0ZP56_9TELE
MGGSSCEKERRESDERGERRMRVCAESVTVSPSSDQAKVLLPAQMDETEDYAQLRRQFWLSAPRLIPLLLG